VPPREKRRNMVVPTNSPSIAMRSVTASAPVHGYPARTPPGTVALRWILEALLTVAASEVARGYDRGLLTASLLVLVRRGGRGGRVEVVAVGGEDGRHDEEG
jgi:hypothetical protein